MAGRFSNLLGTLYNTFQLGKGGPLVKANAGTVEARDATDSVYAAISAALFSTYGNDFTLNAGATSTGADWKFTISRPSTGQTHDIKVVLPAIDPASGHILSVSSFLNDIITLQWKSLFTVKYIDTAVVTDGDQVYTLLSSQCLWHALTVNGLRQQPSSYRLVGNQLTIPAEVVWRGAGVFFEYIF